MDRCGGEARREPAVAYSYLRLSSKRQANAADGKKYRDGFRRQIAHRDRYLAENPHLTLDTRLVLHDIGVSGFTGANAAPGGQGKLAAFLAEVRQGRIAKGSYLLVESLDRMSRQQVSRAQAILLDLVNSGIVVVSLADGQVYREDAHPTQFIISIMSLTRAHEESVVKAGRLRDTWEQKRRVAGERKLSGRCPAWLKLVDGEFVPHKDRVRVIKEILRHLADGLGRDRIAMILNQRGEKPWGHGHQWHGGTVQKLTDNRALIGEYHPHKLDYEERNGVMVARRVPAGDPIPDYYPRVVDDELWARARRVAEKRRLGKARNEGGRLGTVVSNIFGPVAVCGVCKRRMNHRDRGPRSFAVLRCSGERAGTCTNGYRYPYQDTEDVILSWLVKVDITGGAPGEIARLSADLDTQVAMRDELRRRGERIVRRFADDDEFSTEPLADIRREMGAIKQSIASLASKIRLLKEAGGRDEREMAVAMLHRLKRENAPAAQVFAVRSRIRQLIRDTVVGMWCFPDGGIDVITVDGGYHCFRDGFMWHDDDGIWIPSAMALAHGGQTATKAEMARRQAWLREFYEK